MFIEVNAIATIGEPKRNLVNLEHVESISVGPENSTKINLVSGARLIVDEPYDQFLALLKALKLLGASKA